MADAQIRVIRIGRKHRASVILHSIRKDKRVRTLRIALEIPLRGHTAEIRVIHIQENHIRSPAQIVIQLAFRRHDALEAAESKKVGLAHIRDQAIIRKGDVHKFLDVSRMACAHLHDSDPGL